MLPPPANLAKSEVLATLKYCWDSDVKVLGHLSIVSGAEILRLLYVICPGWFYDRESLIYAL